MVNKQRVRRIKNLIYAFIILILLLPVLLMVALSLKILDTNREILKRLSSQPAASRSEASSLPAPDNDYVLEPESRAGNVESQPESTGGSSSGYAREPDSNALPEIENSISGTRSGASNGSSISGMGNVAMGSGKTPAAGNPPDSADEMIASENISRSGMKDVNINKLGEEAAFGNASGSNDPGTGVGIHENPQTGR